MWLDQSVLELLLLGRDPLPQPLQRQQRGTAPVTSKDRLGRMKAASPESIPGRRKGVPVLWSSPIPRATSSTSAPDSSQTLAISLMNEILVARKALAASLIISALATSVRTSGASSGSYSSTTASPAQSPSSPTTTRSGF